MQFALQTVDRTKVSLSIVTQLVEAIQAGAFAPGSALPAERGLASQLGVSRTSVREAIRVLEHAGVLDVRTGIGTFVSEDALTHAAFLRARAAAEGDQSPLDIVVVRCGLEPVSAEEAALHRGEGDLDALRAVLAENETTVATGGDPRPVDLEFHRLLAAASHNSVLIALMTQLLNMMRGATWQAYADRSRRWTGRPQENLDDHRAVVNAIAERDPVLARAAVMHHLEGVKANIVAEAAREATTSARHAVVSVPVAESEHARSASA